MTLADFEKDNFQLQKTVFYNFIIIGEASLNIPEQIQARYPHVPWRVMVAMRNVMAHEYFQINRQIVWHIIKNNLPPLIVQLEDIWERESSQII
jgi:uncharacterized protein with HEPN domain